MWVVNMYVLRRHSALGVGYMRRYPIKAAALAGVTVEDGVPKRTPYTRSLVFVLFIPYVLTVLLSTNTIVKRLVRV